jgi:hypothetical protein
LGGGERFGEHADRALLAGVVVATLLLLSLLLGFRFGRDQGIYAAVAETIVHGGAPYRDAWDFKPPAVFFVYALARLLLGPGMEAVRVVEAAALASLFPAFAMLSRRFLDEWRAGILAAALAVFAHVQLEYWDTAQPESFGGVALVWALVCATVPPPAQGRPAGMRRLWAWSGAGLLYALAALFKPHLGVGFVVSLGFVMVAEAGRENRAAAWRPVFAFLGGALVALVAAAGYFAWHQAWGDLLDVFLVFLPEYHAIRFEAAGLPLYLLRAFWDSLLGFTAYAPLGMVLLWALAPLTALERRAALHVTLVGALPLVGVALQARFYPYHFGAVLPLWSLLAGWGLWKAWLRLRRTPIGALAALALLALLAVKAPEVPAYGGGSFWERCRLRFDLLVGKAGAPVENLLHSAGDVHFGANRRVAAWLATRTPRDGSLYVWGFEPMLYGMADRRPASAYIYNVPQRLEWSQRELSRRRLMEDLGRDPPAAIVVVAHDAREGVTGNRRDSLEELEDFPALRSLIAESYARAWRLEDLVIYARSR